MGPLLAILERRKARRRLGCALVFHRISKSEAGAPVLDYHKACRAALKTAMLPLTLRPYDLRRNALRNLIRSGTHDAVAMAISGHPTRSTFDRYNITSVDGVAAAIERVAKMAPSSEGTGPEARQRAGRGEDRCDSGHGNPLSHPQAAASLTRMVGLQNWDIVLIDWVATVL